MPIKPISAHTPGPWRVIIDDSGDRPLTVPAVFASEELDCAIVHWDGFWQPYWQSARGEREWNANARLIAAAPELLEALEGLLPDFTGGLDPTEPEAVVKARAAIAKARGEA